MQLAEKQELVRLLNLYQNDLLGQNLENIENEITEDFVAGVKAKHEHARIQHKIFCLTRQVYQDMMREIIIDMNCKSSMEVDGE